LCRFNKEEEIHQARVEKKKKKARGRGLHSSVSQLNLSRV
jgi:hypothetical protein